MSAKSTVTTLDSQAVSITRPQLGVITMPAHNEISLDAEQLAPGEIIVDSIRQWRSDCQSGQFKIGASTMRGSKLDLELVGAQLSEGEFFGYPHQKWLSILFVDPDGVLASIMFKTESLDNFEELRRTHRICGESLLGKTVRATMCKRSSKASGNGYYAVEFEVISAGKFAEAIAQFRAQHYHPQMLRQLEDAGNGHVTP